MRGYRRLYRSTSDKIIFGVCGGVAEYLCTDTIIVRVFMVLLAIFSGYGLGGIVLYIVLTVVIPKNPGDDSPEGEDDQR